MRVLYVEDNEQDADLTCRRLARLVPDTAISAVHTLADARARLAADAAAGRLPDVLLVDVRLPDGNGLELLGEVRAQSLPVAVVMLTGSGDEALVVAALRSGADDYVVKAGAYIDRLPATLAGAVQSFRQVSAQRPAPIRVLYAEPSASDTDLLRRHLARYAPHMHLEAVCTAQDVLARLPPAVDAAAGPGRSLRPDVARAYRRLRKRARQAKRLAGGPERDAALHEMRKAAKRARYAADALTPSAGKPAERFAALMKQLQSVLGDHHDTVVARAAIRDLGIHAHRAGENAFTYGLLYQLDAGRARVLSDEAAQVWREARRKKHRRWLA